MKILLVEDHRLVADAMQIMLKQLGPDVEVQACYSTQHALSALEENARFDLVLSDLLMPGIDGLGLLSALKNRDLNIPVVIITGVDEDKAVKEAFEKGAAGFISKSLPSVELVNGLKQVMAGGQHFPNHIDLEVPHVASYARAKSQSENDATKTRTPGAKQLQVLQLMADGNSNKQISQIVGISEATVKYHTAQLFKLLSVKNRTSCVREAQTRGILNGYETAL